MSYDKAFTDALQFAWGEGFLSPGGPSELRTLLTGHDIKGMRVLDIGSGLGGFDLLLVNEHGAAQVTGIDVDRRMVEQARQLAISKGLSARIAFQRVEPGPLPFADASFDAVFSKDSMIHIPGKRALYTEVLRVLKPGGLFIASDWLFAEGAATSPVVKAWVKDNPLGFMFTTLMEATTALRAAGFSDVRVADHRAFLQVLNREEIELLEGPGMNKLASIVGEELARNRLESARGRQGALDSGDLIPSHLSGRKPT
jgi:ubiquinone/menaquinone biosynthesis C-methylase UbiE